MTYFFAPPFRYCTNFRLQILPDTRITSYDKIGPHSKLS